MNFAASNLETLAVQQEIVFTNCKGVFRWRSSRTFRHRRNQ